MLYKSLLAVIFALYMVYGQDDMEAEDGMALSISSTEGPQADELVSTDSGEFGETDSGDDDDDDESSEESSDDESFEVSSTGEGDDSDDDDESNSIDDDDVEDDEDTSDDGTVDVDTELEDDAESDEDDCLGLTQNQCQEEAAEDGDAECAYNTQTQECYSVVRRAGVHGSGDYDDGFIAAQEAAKEEANELYTVVGVLGGIIGALVIVIAGGGYYFYQKSQKIHTETSTLEMMDTGSMGQTNFISNDTSPMIVQE